MATSSTSKEWLTSAEVAKILRSSPKSVSRWALEGRLPFVWTLGGPSGRGNRRYPRHDIEELARSLEHEPGEETP